MSAESWQYPIGTSGGPGVTVCASWVERQDSGAQRDLVFPTWFSFAQVRNLDLRPPKTTTN